MSDDGLVIVYTGNGKGKTTAALGMALRAVGYNMKVCMIQFIKGSWHYGEIDAIKRLNPVFELVLAGSGFVGIIDDNKDVDEHKKMAMYAMKISKEKIFSNNYDLVILDEINYAINLGLLDIQDVIDIIESKPKRLTIALTGNYAKEEIIDFADLVTEMKEIKHPFKSGIKAKRGIDF